MVKKIKIKSEYIKLDQLLKLSEVVDSGGHAKVIILSGEVRVNGQITEQRGKKIKPGDKIKIDNIEIEC